MSLLPVGRHHAASGWKKFIGPAEEASRKGQKPTETDKCFLPYKLAMLISPILQSLRAAKIPQGVSGAGGLPENPTIADA